MNKSIFLLLFLLVNTNTDLLAGLSISKLVLKHQAAKQQLPLYAPKKNTQSDENSISTHKSESLTIRNQTILRIQQENEEKA